MGSYGMDMRKAPAQTRYGSYLTPFKTDIIQSYIYAIFAALFFTWLIILPSYRMTRKVVRQQAMTLAAGYVLFSVLIANYSYEWQTASVTSHMLYKPYSKEEIYAEVGLKVGLRGVNVTLLGHPEHQVLSNGDNETINYNEALRWSDGEGQNGAWDEGRFGFGIFSSNQNQQFRKLQLRGSPWPIQSVAEWFTLDGERIRWGRWYRVGGYYAHIMLWTAVPTWFIAVVTVSLKPFIGGMWLFGLGIEVLSAMIIWTSVINKAKPALKIPFEHGALTLKYGVMFYHTWMVAILLTLSGPAIMIAALKGWVRWDYRVMNNGEDDPNDPEGRQETARRIAHLFGFNRVKQYAEDPNETLEKVVEGDGNYLYGRVGRRSSLTPDPLPNMFENDEARRSSMGFGRIQLLLLQGEVAQSVISDSDLPEGIELDPEEVMTAERSRVSYRLGGRRPSKMKLEVEARAREELEKTTALV